MVARGLCSRSGRVPVTHAKPGAGCNDSLTCLMAAVPLRRGSAECSFATSARKRSGGVRSDHMQKIFEDTGAVFRQERFGMEQHAFDGPLRQAAAHDVAVIAPCRDFEFRGDAA